MLEFISILIWLIASHYLCDYVFQTDSIATGKNRNIEVSKFGVHWSYWLTAHSVTHGIGVGLVSYLFTNNILLATLVLSIETVLHFAIDFTKCEGKINLEVDQLLHFLCKVILTGFIVQVI